MEINFFKNEELKKLFKPFLILFLISFLIINWNETSWIFNYKFISGVLSNFFLEENSEASFNSLEENKTPITEFEYSDKENSLEIPKIEVFAPLVFVENSNETEISRGLKMGVILFPESVLPGQPGQTIILGHSAPPGWPKINYDWVFSRLNEMQEGDEFVINFDHQKYTYSVTKKIFLERDEKTPQTESSKNILFLISCWPPGKDFKRIVVEALEISKNF